MITSGMLKSLMEYDSPLLANTLDYIDDTPPHEFFMSGDIRSVTPGLGPTVGIAVTCKLDSSTPGNKPDGALHISCRHIARGREFNIHGFGLNRIR